jgi:CheY-like chemotaxis protein
MIESEQLRAELHEALLHLFDPDYAPPDLLRVVLGCSPDAAAGTVQTAIIRAIKLVCPAPEGEGEGRVGRACSLLHHRFVMGLTQEETADRLRLSVRHVGRVQREATHILSRRLWERYCGRDGESVTPSRARARAASTVSSDDATPDWRAQLAADIASLRSGAPGATSCPEKAIQEALLLGQVLADRDVRVEGADTVSAGEIAAIHPTALRQVLITTMGLLGQQLVGSRIDIRASTDADRVIVELAGEIDPRGELPDLSLQEEILAPFGATIDALAHEGTLAFRIALRRAGDVRVLVIDDNPDMLYFYGRCTRGTRYRVVHEDRGTQAFQAIEAHAPSIVVLDIMLPDIDGWQLLSQLHQHHATRHIPVVVCSVIRERELALALGAAGFLPKPFTHRQFCQVLDEVVGQEPTARPGA